MSERDYQLFEGLRLPLRRSNRNLQDDAGYLASIAEQISHIRPYLGEQTDILDFGCGQGRFLNGLLHTKTPFKSYLGADISPNSVAWCCRNLSYDHHQIGFLWYNYANARYNAQGARKHFLPLADAGVDLIFASSVFTHLDQADTARIARALYQKLRPGGVLYRTAFLEQGVEPVTVNPDGYLGSKGAGDTPLHWVRYEKTAFQDCFQQIGFQRISDEDDSANLIARSGQRWMILQKPPVAGA